MATADTGRTAATSGTQEYDSPAHRTLALWPAFRCALFGLVMGTNAAVRAAKPMVNLRSQIAHWHLTKTQKLRDGRPLLGPQRKGRRLLRRLGWQPLPKSWRPE